MFVLSTQRVSNRTDFDSKMNVDLTEYEPECLFLFPGSIVAIYENFHWKSFEQM